MQELQQKINNLPEDLKKEVMDFIDFLTSRKKIQRLKAKLDWIGGLKDFKDQFTSVELQHKASEWRKGFVSSRQ